jgi:5'-methylthioadenosine phosphorylase
MATPIAVIGGSGLYTLLADAKSVAVTTPYGPPSDDLMVGEIGGREVVFLPRHGRDHQFPPHQVPYLANLWALHSLGVRQVLAPYAVGALDQSLAAGDLVIPDQLLDRTSGRSSTYYDHGAVHVPFADPYCPRGRAAIEAASTSAGWPARNNATMVVINGPRFASRAESQWHAASGGTVVNMTGMPEAGLARELAMCFTALTIVTDLDAGVSSGETVTQEEVFAVFRHSIDRLRDLLFAVVATLDDRRDCPCPRALDGTPAEGTSP